MRLATKRTQSATYQSQLDATRREREAEDLARDYRYNPAERAILEEQLQSTKRALTNEVAGRMEQAKATKLAKTRCPRPEKIIAKAKELVNAKLEDFDYLTSKLYNDPETTQLYEIINVYLCHATHRFMSTGRPRQHADDGILDPTQFQSRDITGPQGTAVLCDLFDHSMITALDMPWPCTTSDWIIAQSQDEAYAVLMQRRVIRVYGDHTCKHHSTPATGPILSCSAMHSLAPCTDGASWQL